MTLKVLLTYGWKLAVCGLAFFVGITLGSMFAIGIGLPAPELPAGVEAATLNYYTLLGSLLLALALAQLSQGLSGGFVSRWLILSMLIWISHGMNNALEAAIFTTMSAAASFTLVMYLPAALLCSAAVTWLFPPAIPGAGFSAQLRSYFASRHSGAWAWRLLAAFLAFPIVYFSFGSLISPLVLDYYRQGIAELTVPGMDRLVPVLLLRSLLFLLVCLPVLIAWQQSNWRLFVTLGLALFMLVGGVNLLQAYWLPSMLRVVHSLEILVDELVYAGALVMLLARNAPQPFQRHVPQQV
jgi:hypothetical protein